MFERFTSVGIAVAGIDVGESYGSPDGRGLFSALYRELTGRRGFSAKPVLLGRSRGGLMTLSWAEENPEKVAAWAGIYPVCNIASYPGIEEASSAYHMTPAELTAQLTDHNPIDRLEPLARAKIPLFAIHGDVDTLVPLEANSGEMKKRYDALGGQMQLIIPKGQGHNMWEGFFHSQELVDFVVRSVPGVPARREASTSDEVLQRLRREVDSGPFARLYSNTYYNIVGRIEEDGFLRESNYPLKGYDGMYSRTVGAAVSLLLATGQPGPSERLIQCVLNAMRDAGMNRIPHAFDKRRDGNASAAERYPILGRADQLDGQAHVIMAWGRLANYRGRTAFEDSTYPVISALLNSSIRPPYARDTTGGKIPDLMFNPVLEHSRTERVVWRYDLLTQFFIGAALTELIPVAERRNDQANAREWRDRLQILQAAIAEHFIISRDGKPVFAELLLTDSNKVFEGMGWVNMAPIAAQWNPFGREVIVNTVQYMRDHLSKERDGHRWLPTDSWPGGGFSPQIIGKGVAWELELATREKDWQKALELVELVEDLHPNSPIYMENAFLRTANGKPLSIQETDTGYAFRHSPWALADPGNGEQVAWWCWAVANLRKALGLKPVPERMAPEPDLDSSRNTSAKALVTNGLEYTFFAAEDSAAGRSPGQMLLRKGSLPGVGLPPLPAEQMPNRVECHGYFFARQPGEYVFRVRSTDRAHLLVDGTDMTESDHPSAPGPLRLDKGYHPFAYDVTNFQKSSVIEISCSLDGGEFTPLSPEMLYQKKPARSFVPMPEILPEHAEFERGSPLTVSISSPGHGMSIFFTAIDGESPSIGEGKPFPPRSGKGTDKLQHYSGPFTVTSSGTVIAEARDSKGARSSQAIAAFVAVPQKIKITVNPAPDPRYAGNGPSTLLDGVKGTMDLSDKRWLGFQGTDVEVVIDLRERRQVKEISVGSLHNPVAWVLLPKRLRLSVSDDGKSFKEAAVLDAVAPITDRPEVRYTALLQSPVRCQYMKLHVESAGVLPPSHSAAGRDSWLFLDEIVIH